MGQVGNSLRLVLEAALWSTDVEKLRAHIVVTLSDPKACYWNATRVLEQIWSDPDGFHVSQRSRMALHYEENFLEFYLKSWASQAVVHVPAAVQAPPWAL
jgi:hypothetical protein